ncbi:MAG: hypothetical protein ACKPJO_04200, partial [Dolichospermum sp.]
GMWEVRSLFGDVKGRSLFGEMWGGRSLFVDVRCDRCFGMWEVRSLFVDVRGRSLFGGCGGAIAFWGVGVRSLFGMWEGDSEALLQAVRCYNKNSYSFLEKTLWN